VARYRTSPTVKTCSDGKGLEMLRCELPYQYYARVCSFLISSTLPSEVRKVCNIASHLVIKLCITECKFRIAKRKLRKYCKHKLCITEGKLCLAKSITSFQATRIVQYAPQSYIEIVWAKFLPPHFSPPPTFLSLPTIFPPPS
jgi:hypothetical protein